MIKTVEKFEKEKTAGKRKYGRLRGITRERIIVPAHKSFYFSTFCPPDYTSHSSSIVALSGCQISESHLEHHITTSVKVTVCDMLLYIVNVWIPTLFHQLLYKVI